MDTPEISMTSSRPYLLRAMFDWIVDNNCTPYVLVDANITGVSVPQNFVKAGEIVLNISPGAVVGMDMNMDSLSFNARFGGVPTDIYTPIIAIKGIYARENGKGMMFEYEELPPEPSVAKKPTRPSLTVVK